ncbi:small integral membrane protein 8-like [Argonauta hians]
MEDSKVKEAKANPSSYGWRQAPTTTLFRITNFELFVKPNKPVMYFGISLFAGCAAYILYMNLTDEKKGKTYVSLAEDGSLVKRPQTSRWD